MAHRPPDAAIFSPSVARQAASTAKDWSYVDNWLASKYNGRRPPPFERNPDTLKALLALANLNEAADESRDLLACAEADALQGIRSLDDEDMADKDGGQIIDVSTVKDQILAALEESLTREGRACLDAMATSAVHLGIALPEPAQLGQAMLDLQARNFDLEQAAARVGVLQRYTDLELARLDRLLEDVNGDWYRPPADLPRQNLDMQRKTKAMAKQLLEMRDKISSLARVVCVPNPTIEQLRLEEENYLELLKTKRSLDQQVSEFEGLPPDTEQARQQLDVLHRELRSITRHRDAVFENLVERETPRKGR